MDFITHLFIARHNTVRTPKSRSLATFYYAESCVYVFRCICNVWPARHAHNWSMLNVSEVQNSARGSWGLWSLRNRLTSGLWVKTKTNAVPDGTSCSTLSLFAICLKNFHWQFLYTQRSFLALRKLVLSWVVVTSGSRSCWLHFSEVCTNLTHRWGITSSYFKWRNWWWRHHVTPKLGVTSQKTAHRSDLIRLV
jgi:hypothetical protein